MKKDFDLLPIPVQKIKEQPKLQATTSKDLKDGLRIVALVNNELAEKLKDYVYWERTTQQDVLKQALEYFLKNKDIKSRPESVKNKSKTGRKRKAI